MRKIAIYGAGGFGREVACLLRAINKEKRQWDFIGFFDDGIDVGTLNRYGPILGGLSTLNGWTEPLNVVFSIANPSILKKLVESIRNPHIKYPNIYAPGIICFDEESLNVGRGNLFMFGCRLSCDVTIGSFNLCNGFVSFGHDVKIGDFNIIGPMVRFSGNTHVGNSNLFGVQSIVLQGLRIGSNSTVGAGSVIIRHTDDNCLYFGNPAKRVTIK